MNNLQNYDMLSRANADAKADYEARFKEAQERKNAETALTYESITAPFIEQSGVNLLKKGARIAGQKIGLSEDDLNDLGDVANKIKSGDVGGAINKARSMRNNLMTKEQENFLNSFNDLTKTEPNKLISKGLSRVKPKTVRFENPVVDEPPTSEQSVFSTLENQLKQSGISPSTPTKSLVPRPGQPPLSQDDPLSPPKFTEVDAGTNVPIDRNPQLPKQTEQEPVLDDNGNPIPDENEVIRNKLEFADETDASPAEIAQNKRELAKLIDRTEAPAESNTYQDALSFLRGDKGTASASWGKNRLEADDIPTGGSSTPLKNPADFAPDIQVSERDLLRGVRRGQDIRITSQRTEPTVKPQPKPEPETEAEPEPETEAEPKGLSADEVDRILGQTEDDIPAGLDEAPSGLLQPKNLRARYKQLSNEGKSSYENNIKKAGTDIDQQKRSDLLQQEEQEDFRQKRGQYQQQQEQTQTQDKPPPQAEDKPPPVEDKPPPVEEDKPPTIEEDIEKATEKGGEEVAEGGGVEDPITDIIALGGALGALFGGLHKAHQSSNPPPLLQVNPTLQLGQGQD